MINRVGFIQQQVLCMFASSCPFWNYCFSVTMWLSRKNWLLVSIEENKTPIVRLFLLPPTRPEFLKCCGVTAIFGMYSCLPVVCHASVTKALKLFDTVKMFSKTFWWYFFPYTIDSQTLCSALASYMYFSSISILHILFLLWQMLKVLLISFTPKCFGIFFSIQKY